MERKIVTIVTHSLLRMQSDTCIVSSIASDGGPEGEMGGPLKIAGISASNTQ